jgi:hypothetical protein
MPVVLVCENRNNILTLFHIFVYNQKVDSYPGVRTGVVSHHLSNGSQGVPWPVFKDISPFRVIIVVATFPFSLCQ